MIALAPLYGHHLQTLRQAAGNGGGEGVPGFSDKRRRGLARVTRGQGEVRPQSTSQLHRLCRVGSLPTSLCGNLIPSSHQQTPKTTQTQNHPPQVTTWSTCSPDPRTPAAAPEWGGSWLVTQTVLGDQESMGSSAVVTISAAFWGPLNQVRSWQGHFGAAQTVTAPPSPPQPSWMGQDGPPHLTWLWASRRMATAAQTPEMTFKQVLSLPWGRG